MTKRIKTAFLAIATLIVGAEYIFAQYWEPTNEPFVAYTWSRPSFGGCNVEMKDEAERTTASIRFTATVVGEYGEGELTHSSYVYIGRQAATGSAYFPSCRTVERITVTGIDRR